MCNHKKTICPNHEGSFECTPFCAKCEGEQEFCPICEALEIVLADLEENNNHTLGKLLIWAYREETLTNEQALIMFEAWTLARDFIYYGKTCDNTEELKWYQNWLEMPERKQA